MLPVAGFVAVLVAAAVSGLPMALLVLAATLLVAAIGAVWSSLQALAGDSHDEPEDWVGAMIPGAEQEQKQAVLRALKDLEFERSVGKIDEHDYEQLRSRYRDTAKRLLQGLDERTAPDRAKAEALVVEHLASRGLAPQPGPPESHASPSARSEEPAAAHPRLACPGCGASNEPDASFCKKCGAKVTAPSPEQPGRKGEP
jgi:hypothetical protein